MKYSLRIRPEAELDLLEASNWYDGCRIGLGDEFIDDYKVTLQRIIEYPKSAPVIENETRRALLKVFQYSIFYLFENDVVYILAVAHHSRDSDWWKSRLEA